MEPTTATAAQRLAPEAFAERAQVIEREVGRVIVGQRELVRQTLTGLLAGGHVLLEGVPGLGKTLLVRTLADVIDCTFNRIQFTPDLMPADITGTNILIEEGGQRVFRFQPGPSSRTSSWPTRSTGPRPRPSRPARGDAGAPGHRRRPALPARRPVLRARHAEPARDGGHVPAARGPARPVPVQGHGPLPVRGGPGRDHRPHDRRRGRDREQGLHRGRDRRDAAARAGGADRPARDRVRGERARRHAPGSAAGAASSPASTSATAPRRAAPRRS